MKITDWSNFKIHCSSISNLMSRPKGVTRVPAKLLTAYNLASEKEAESRVAKEVKTIENFYSKLFQWNNYPLSEGAKKHIISRYAREKYNTRRAVVNSQNPWTIKGSVLQDEALALISKVHRKIYTTEVDVCENDFLRGRCDSACFDANKIIEVKTTWSADTFFPYLYNGLPKDTWMQMQGYLDLYNMQQGLVCYTLVNTPKHLVDQELANNFKRFTYGEIDREAYDEKLSLLESFYNYDKIPAKKRIITFEVHKDEEFIESVRKKVVQAREFLASFEQIHMENKKVIALSETYTSAFKEIDTESDSGDSREGYEE